MFLSRSYHQTSPAPLIALHNLRQAPFCFVNHLHINVILKIKVLFQGPINKFFEQNLTSIVCVNFVEFGLPVINGANPLLDGGLDGVGGELLLRDPVVVTGVDPKIKKKLNRIQKHCILRFLSLFSFLKA